jgi:hypothetical protein
MIRFGIDGYKGHEIGVEIVSDFVSEQGQFPCPFYDSNIPSDYGGRNFDHSPTCFFELSFVVFIQLIFSCG